MAALSVVLGIVLMLGGGFLCGFGFQALFRRPGWGGQYGKGAFAAIIGGFLFLAGIVNLLTA